MHIYAFGSVCRGEIALDSDIDLLALTAGHDSRLSPSKYSIYSYNKMRTMWSAGSPFAWHLYLESRLLFASDGLDTLHSMGEPCPYRRYIQDCEKFYGVFLAARSSLKESVSSYVFDLSTIFLSVRNLATCFSLGVLDRPMFSRHSALKLGDDFNVPISSDCYSILERSRVLCTRGQGTGITPEELVLASSSLTEIDCWMKKLLVEATRNERVQQQS